MIFWSMISAFSASEACLSLTRLARLGKLQSMIFLSAEMSMKLSALFRLHSQPVTTWDLRLGILTTMKEEQLQAEISQNVFQAFQFTDEHGEVCPAGWRPGEKGFFGIIFSK